MAKNFRRSGISHFCSKIEFVTSLRIERSCEQFLIPLLSNSQQTKIKDCCSRGTTPPSGASVMADSVSLSSTPNKPEEGLIKFYLPASLLEPVEAKCL
jgi:hypothetical protein